MREKPVVWLGSARDDLRAFPEDARRVAGFQLWRVQQGLEPNDWKSVPVVGTGVNEIRVRTDLEHRVLYIAKLPEAVYVLHAFEKRARKTPRQDLEVARQRLRLLMIERTRRKRQVPHEAPDDPLDR